MASARSSLRLDTRSPRRPESLEEGVALTLLDGFGVRIGRRSVELPLSAQRVVAFVALHERPLLRPFVAGSIWLDWPESRAAGNLRSALWRIQRVSPALLEADARTLRLDAQVRVDLRQAERAARAELDGRRGDVSLRMLAADLLPDWYEDWVLIERERFRQLRLRALEAVCERRVREGSFAAALDAGLLALAGEPLRESAHRALVRLHLADGNAAEAVRQYRLCRRLLREQLGVEPSHWMRELVHGLDTGETMR